MKKTFVFFFVVTVAGTFIHAQHCGGTERWAVKDGTDPRVGQVDFARVIPISVSQLVRLPEPHPLPKDNVTRVIPNEAHLYRLRVRLVKWKHEAPGDGGDDDYHLVLTDDTQQYTDEHAHPAVP